MIELSVERGPQEVQQAIVQFAARRSYRLTKPWWIEGIRIEAPQKARPHKNEAGRGTFWASLWDLPQAPRIEVVVKRKRGTSRLNISVSNHPESIQLAYELHTYLLDGRSYDGQCPPICPRCGNPVRTVTARYCGRCGQRLVSGLPTSPMPLEVSDDAGRSIHLHDTWEPPAAVPHRFSGRAQEADIEDSVELLIEPDDVDAGEAEGADARDQAANLVDRGEPVPVESTQPDRERNVQASDVDLRAISTGLEPVIEASPLRQAEAESETISEAEPPDDEVEGEGEAARGDDGPVRPRRALAED